MIKLLQYFLIFLLYPCIVTPQSVQLWGVAEEGGDFNGGTLFSLTSDGDNFAKHYDFKGDGGFNPVYTRLIMGGDGYLYGITSEGGKYSDGVIFRINTATGHFERVYEMQNYPDIFLLNNHQDGKTATGSLTKSSTGTIYGMASLGGTENQGSIFSFDPLERTFSKLFDFNDSLHTGKVPHGSLTESAGSWFYGMTSEGGTDNQGLIFRFNSSSHQYLLMHELTYDDGINPTGDLLEAKGGKLYGTAPYGGLYSFGTLFRVNPYNLSFSKLADFGPTSATGINPSGALTKLDSSTFYGITTNGGILGFGTIFSYNVDSDLLHTVYSFDELHGIYPVSGLALAGNGKFYGTAPLGGANSKGVLYSFDPLTLQVETHVDFNGGNGSYPQGALTYAPDGWLYGMTTNGGDDDQGTVFKFNPLDDTFIQLYQFRISHQGALPESILQFDNNTLYGITNEGGDFHAGIMYRFDLGSDSLQELFEFRQELDKAYLPRENLIIGNDQKIYGVSLWHYDGGGTIYNYDPATHDYDTVANSAFQLGENPQSTLLLLPDGNMIGTMSRGGSQDDGVIFHFNPVTQLYEVVYDWEDISKGQHPRGRLVLYNDGMIYGTTESGGDDHNGIIFRFNPSTHVLTKVFDFNSATDGENPKGLVSGNDGWLYGLTHDGGSKNGGTLFRFDPESLLFQKQIDFDSATTGTLPEAALLYASDGNFYGCNTLGGMFGSGTLYKYAAETNSLTVIHHFTYNEGGKPHGELMEYKMMTGIHTPDDASQFHLYPNPAGEKFLVTGSGVPNHSVRLSITDLTGRMVFETKVKQWPVEMPTGKLVSGIYNVQVRDNDKVMMNQMLVIQ